jgi:hypothetical protein
MYSWLQENFKDRDNRPIVLWLGCGVVVVAAGVWAAATFYMRAIVFIGTTYREAAVFVVIISVLLIFPILHYVVVGWKYKKVDITNSIDDSAKKIYLEKFQNQLWVEIGKKLNREVNEDDAHRVFLNLYHSRFGRRYFIFPIILISIIIIISSSLVAEAIIAVPEDIWPQLGLSSAAISALAGAYMWVVSDFISRSRRMDFSPANVMWGALRIVISVPLGLSLGSIITKEVSSFVAFGLGAFPLTTIDVALRQLWYKQLKLELGPTENSPLLYLDGIDKLLAERLANEDITSVVQLAYCDPIQLTMRTNLTFNAVVDLVSQALAWVYFGEKLTVIRPLGIRGAFEVRQLINDLDASDNPLAKDAAEKIVPAIATKLELKSDKISFVLRQIAYDPYTDFISSTWS